MRLLGAATLTLASLQASLAFESAKFARGDYLYFQKTADDGGRAIHSRCAIGESESGRKIKKTKAVCAGDVEELLDENVLASDINVGSAVVSPGHGLMAYTLARAGKEDYSGYSVEVKNLKGGGGKSSWLRAAR